MLLLKNFVIDQDENVTLAMRKECYLYNFGTLQGLGEETEYIENLKSSVEKFPEGIILIYDKLKLVGVSEVTLEGKIATLQFIHIVETYRGQGIGALAMEYIEEILQKYGVKELHLRACKNNVRSIQFFEKHNFEVLSSYGFLDIFEVVQMKKVLKS